MMLLPRFSLDGFAGYFSAAAGVVLGFALFTSPMNNLVSSLKKKA